MSDFPSIDREIQETIKSMHPTKKLTWLQKVMAHMIFKWLEKQWISGTWSWKTTVSGVIPGFILLLSELYKILDGDVSTVCNETICVTAIGMIAIGWSAKDKTKTGTPSDAHPKTT